MSDAILAYRKWLVSDADGILRSPLKDSPWPAGERMEAECLKGHGLLVTAGPQCSTSPGSRCRCGVYGVKTEDSVHSFGSGRRPVTWDGYHATLAVVGQVSLWGKIIEHEDGFRGEFAYPYSLEIVRPTANAAPMACRREIADKIARKLRANYAVDVVVNW